MLAETLWFELPFRANPSWKLGFVRVINHFIMRLTFLVYCERYQSLSIDFFCVFYPHPCVRHCGIERREAVFFVYAHFNLRLIAGVHDVFTIADLVVNVTDGNTTEQCMSKNIQWHAFHNAANHRQQQRYHQTTASWDRFPSQWAKMWKAY